MNTPHLPAGGFAAGGRDNGHPDGWIDERPDPAGALRERLRLPADSPLAPVAPATPYEYSFLGNLREGDEQPVTLDLDRLAQGGPGVLVADCDGDRWATTTSGHLLCLATGGPSKWGTAAVTPMTVDEVAIQWGPLVPVDPTRVDLAREVAREAHEQFLSMAASAQDLRAQLAARNAVIEDRGQQIQQLTAQLARYQGRTGGADVVAEAASIAAGGAVDRVAAERDTVRQVALDAMTQLRAAAGQIEALQQQRDMAHGDWQEREALVIELQARLEHALAGRTDTYVPADPETFTERDVEQFPAMYAHAMFVHVETLTIGDSWAAAGFTAAFDTEGTLRRVPPGGAQPSPEVTTTDDSGSQD